VNSETLPPGPVVSVRHAGGLAVRYCPETWRIMIQGPGGPAIFLHAHQVRPVVIGILHTLKNVDKPQFIRAVDRIRQFLR